MPIYEYRCPDCGRRVSLFFRSFGQAERETARCPHCQGANLQRLVSRVAPIRSEESRLESLEDPGLMAGLDSEDPRAMAGLMRRMSAETGEPMDPEMAEVVGRMEAGESMETIESAMPDLAASPDDGGF